MSIEKFANTELREFAKFAKSKYLGFMLENTAQIKALIKKAIKDNPEINQKVVASMVGISKSYLTEILRDDKKGSFDLVKRIAEAAGVSLAEIMLAGGTSTVGFSATSGAEIIRKNSTKQQPTPLGDTADSITSLLNMARKILESGSNWSDSLASDIKSFYKGMMIENGDRRKSDQPDKIPISGDRRNAVG